MPPQNSFEASPYSLVDLKYWQRVEHDVTLYQWSKTSWRGALVCLPIIAAWIFGGIIFGQARWTVFSVAGAVLVSFGAFQNLGKNRVVDMVILLVGLDLAIWTGNVAGYLGWYNTVILAMVCGYVFGVMTMLGYTAWWLGLQWIIALLVYGSHAYHPRQASENALAVVCGGASMVIYLSAIRSVTQRFFPTQDQPPLNQNFSFMQAVLASLHPRMPAGRYALRVAIAVGLSTLIAHLSGLPNGYWMPMTAAILLKPDFHEATLRGVNRLLGTLVGAGVASLLLALMRPNNIEMGCLLVIAIGGCLSFMRVNYGLFVACVTAYVALLFALQEMPEAIVAWHRVLATLAGATVALLVSVTPIIGARSARAL